MSLESYLRAVPKAELHVHLEGSIAPKTLLELARRNKVELPAEDLEGLRRWFTYRDFDHFIEVYVAITRCLRTADDYELISYEFGAEMARQNVRYAEVTFSPGTHERLGVSFDTYFDGLCRGRERARRDFAIDIAWIFDIVRNIQEGRERHCDYTLAVALEGMSNAVVGFGLGGKEAGFPPEPFAPWFERAREAGLGITPHAGETAGPESVRGALTSLGADRIGHGVRAVEDPKLIDLLAERRIPLEICPTSNVRLGVVPSLASHPLARLVRAGVVVTINSDDPALFNTTLGEEVAALASQFEFDVETIDSILLNAVEASFGPDENKARLKVDFAERMARLKAEHLGQ